MSASQGNDSTHTIINKPLLKLRLLETLRDGSFEELTHFIETKFVPLDNPVVQDLAPFLLHFAVQVASLKLIKDIVTNWVDQPDKCLQILGTKIEINGRDDDGNTPLHLAALQSRTNVIQFLLDHKGIDETLINDEGLLPLDLCKNLNVAEMMQNKRSNYLTNVIKIASNAFEKKDFKTLEQIYKEPRNHNFMDINQSDPLVHGNTLLHKYVLKNDVETCRWLLNHGANPLLENSQGLSALDIVKSKKKAAGSTNNVNDDLKKLFDDILKEEAVVNATNAIEKAPTYKGYLKKFARMGKGYKLRYFVLSEDGKLSYYKDPAAVNVNKPPRGSLNLASCYLHMDSMEKLKFDVIGGSNTSAKWRLKGNQAMETNNWVMAIQSAIRFAKDKKAASKSKRKKASTTTTTTTENRAILQTPTKVINNINSPSIQKASTFDAQYARTQAKRRQPTRAPLYRRPSETGSVSSSTVELSSNLTESGKNYVNKMIDSRLERTSSLSGHNSLLDGVSGSLRPLSPLGNPKFMTSSSGISYMSMDNLNMSSKSLVGSPSSIISGTNGIGTLYQEGVGDGTDSDLEDEEEHIHSKYNRDDEYLRVEYGPYVEKLNIYQKTIALELSSINEIIDSDDFRRNDDDTLSTIRQSLLRLSSNITDMNALTFKRDEKLVSMLTKQRDMNNVWIQTMKDLEIELEDKSERLATLGRGRRTLKRTLEKKRREFNSQTNLNENSEISLQSLAKYEDDSNDTLDQIAKFITATKEEDELSDGDEFYDAEELMDELAMQQLDNNNETLSYTKSNELGSIGEPIRGVISNNSTVEEPMNNTSSSINSGATDEAIYIKAKHHGLHSMKSHQQEDIMNEKIEEPKKEKEEEKKDAVQDIEDNVKSIKPKKYVAVTKAQRVKEDMIWKEGTFLGYEDGPRKKLALDQDDRPKVSLWAVLKSMIGKDMTRMTLPVVFNEPTSLLQRVAEDVECSYLLDQAATFKDSTLRLLYVSIFTTSCYASTVGRIAKPFNPLLGETFEYARPDKNYRFFAEQVSHHPPISATWTESPKWDFYGESAVDTNFNGRSFGVKHLGLWHIKLRPDCNDDSNPKQIEELYTYKKPDNTVIGILVGNPQVDNHGEVKITNHMTGEYCILNFKARGWRSSSAYEIKGEVFDKNKKRVWVLGGHWNDSIYAKCVTGKSGGSGNNDIGLDNKSNKNNGGKDPGPNYDGNKFLVWKSNPRPNAPFNLTQFAISLNAPQPHLIPWVAPTDTRLRPDQRAMENGEYDKASTEKNRVEEKQRAVRKKREEQNIKYEPTWFTHEIHPVTKQPYWHYKGKYWSERRDKKLSDKGDIF